MQATTLRALPTSAAAALALFLAAAPALTGCTQAYMETLENEMRLAPDELLALRTTEASESLGEARQALIHLDDALRRFAVEPTATPEHAHSDLERLAELAQAAAIDARRRIASINDVAPGYLASVSPTAPAAQRYDALINEMSAADDALGAIFDHLEANLPTLGVAPSPAAADTLREPILAAIAAVDRAAQAGRRFAQTLDAQPDA